MNQQSYSREFYAGLQSGSLQSARRVLPIVFELVHPHSVVDIGCGVGTWLAAARECGASEILGLDGEHIDTSMLVVERANFLPADLAHDRPVLKRFDLAICFEVAEHLPAESAPDFVGWLTQLAPVILFSAAVPHQGGTDHVNEQWPDYWAELFQRCGFVFCDPIRPRIWDDEQVDWWYAQNAFLVLHKDRLPMSPGLEHCRRHTALVHPRMWEKGYTKWTQEYNGLLWLYEDLPVTDLLGKLAVAMRRAIGKRLRAVVRI